jgi:4-amino-4-deoxy-L-arabinose transferase-like glycosyltransferase
MPWLSPASSVFRGAFTLVCLLPLLAIGLFGRDLWTPDEPREADIAWRMSLHPASALAEFDRGPWLEKPPLSYWNAGASIRWLGDSPAAARLPNALYALISAAAVFALATSMGGADLGLIAALIAGSALLAWRVGVWLAPDAALLAGVAVALLGAWRGLHARLGLPKLLWFTLMHAGAAWGFLAKSAVGWAIPALALGTVIVWERRWRELRRPELWAGLLLQAAVIGAWIGAVLRLPAGRADLRALFWNNLAGRFAAVPTFGGVDYAGGHPNTPGKYLLELPVYLLPWTALAVAALWRAGRAARAPDASATAWRFALGASIPWLLLLSVAVTARDVYAAPALTGFALLIALRLGEAPAPVALRITLWTVTTIGGLLLLAGALLEAAGDGGPGGSSSLLAIAVAIALMFRQVAAELRASAGAAAVLGCYGGFAAILTFWGLAFFPRIDAWQDLPRVAAQISRDVGPRPLGLLAPDETTIAMMDHRLGRDVVVTPAGPDLSSLATAAGGWFVTHGPQSRLLVKLPGSAPGDVTRWIAAHTGRRLWSDDDGTAALLERARVGRIVKRYALPQGRRFALLAPADPSAEQGLAPIQPGGREHEQGAE